MKKKIVEYLDKNRGAFFAVYSVLFAFLAYFSMYAFRKPFTTGRFDGSASLPWGGEVDYKILLIVSQVIGYTISKFLGIKVVSESRFNRRGRMIISMILLAELALVGFALAPRSLGFLFLFLNGLPLGMIWGLVFGYLEGRKLTALLGAGLSVSYIVASGAVKSVGKYFLDIGVSEAWMPSITGLCFLPLIFIAVYFLDLIPSPTREEEILRMKRQPMGSKERRAFFRQYTVPLSLLTLLYMALTAYRDFRDNFAREIWDALGFASNPEIFTLSELPIALVVLMALGGLSFIKDREKSFYAVYGLMFSGVATIGLSTFLFRMGILEPVYWMVLVGLGLYLAYVPYGCVFFDDLIAVSGFVGTAGFMIYVTDAFGYLGSIGLMFYKNFGQPNLSWLDFFIGFSYATSVIGAVGFIFSLLEFMRKKKKEART